MSQLAPGEFLQQFLRVIGKGRHYVITPTNILKNYDLTYIAASSQITHKDNKEAKLNIPRLNDSGLCLKYVES